jgi:hypothetical protein
MLVLPACAGRTNSFEDGPEQCADGVDNDDDGKIDCKDPGCFPLAFCSGVDSGPSKKDGFLADRTLVPVDRSVDTKGPDQSPPLSSYGKRCQYKTKDTLCSDGESVCVPGKYGSPGFCSYECQQGGSCPDGPLGTKTHCGYQVNYTTGSIWYCIFTCQQSSCPHDIQCFGTFCF